MRGPEFKKEREREKKNVSVRREGRAVALRLW